MDKGPPPGAQRGRTLQSVDKSLTPANSCKLWPSGQVSHRNDKCDYRRGTAGAPLGVEENHTPYNSSLASEPMHDLAAEPTCDRAAAAELTSVRAAELTSVRAAELTSVQATELARDQAAELTYDRAAGELH